MIPGDEDQMGQRTGTEAPGSLEPRMDGPGGSGFARSPRGVVSELQGVGNGGWLGG